MRVNVIGTGRVGQTMARLVCAAEGLELQDVCNRTHSAAHSLIEQLGAGVAVRHVSDLRPADLWLVAVPDGALAEAGRSVQPALTDGSVLLHFSGFHSAAIFDDTASVGAGRASLHPVRSFADPVSAAETFRGTLCGIEGDSKAVLLAKTFAETIGGIAFDINSKHKARYHAAAVVANNFPVVLQAMAQELWREAGVAPDIAADMGAGLLQSAAANVSELGARGALTGPAARGDADVVVREAEDLADWHVSAGALYEMLSEMAAHLAKEGRVFETK